VSGVVNVVCPYTFVICYTMLKHAHIVWLVTDMCSFKNKASYLFDSWKTLWQITQAYKKTNVTLYVVCAHLARDFYPIGFPHAPTHTQIQAHTHTQTYINTHVYSFFLIFLYCSFSLLCITTWKPTKKYRTHMCTHWMSMGRTRSVTTELRGHASSATHRQTGWGLHQRRWSNDACATPQRRQRHDSELVWI